MKISSWWKDNGYKVRIKIFTILTFPIDVIACIVESLAGLYVKFFSWLLWDLLNGVFYGTGRKVKEDDKSTD